MKYTATLEITDTDADFVVGYPTEKPYLYCNSHSVEGALQGLCLLLPQLRIDEDYKNRHDLKSPNGTLWFEHKGFDYVYGALRTRLREEEEYVRGQGVYQSYWRIPLGNYEAQLRIQTVADDLNGLDEDFYSAVTAAYRGYEVTTSDGVALSGRAALLRIAREYLDAANYSVGEIPKRKAS